MNIREGGYLARGHFLCRRGDIGVSRHIRVVEVAERQALVKVLALLLLLCAPALAEEHRHPKRDQAIHDRFYSTWMMPDNRSISCCHQQDCAPAESKFENNNWMARKEGGEWYSVPPQKIEKERDSPDGRSHLCVRAGKVYCFAPGSGT